MRTLIFIVMLCASMMPGYAFAEDPASGSKSSGKKEAKDSDKRETQDKEKAADESVDADKETGEVKEGDENKEMESADSNPPDDAQFTGDRRIKLLMYDESDVYTITTRYGYQTNIVFAPQEEIELISVGDRSMWQIIPSGNRMFIRPMDEDVTTNMTVLTNKHSYQFDLKSVAADKTTGNIYVAKFVYGHQKKELPLFGAPQNPAAPHAAAQNPAVMVQPPVVQSPPLPANAPFGVGPSVPNPPVPDAMSAPPVNPPATQQAMQPAPGVWQPAPDAPAPMPSQPQALAAASASPADAPPQAVYPNYSYTYAGPDDQAPLQVYDDGKQTYLKYKEVQKPLPSIYVVDRTGKESPVKFNVKGDFVVVDAVAGELALKSGASTVHIYNEVLNPG